MSRPGKILNPETGRYVNKDGKIGRALLHLRSKSRSKTPGDGRDGRRKIKKSIDKEDNLQSYNIKRRFGIDIRKYIKGYKIVGSIGSGINNNIWILCKPQSRDKRCDIIKIQPRTPKSDSLEYEIHMQKEFKKHHLEAPKVLKEIHLKNGKIISILLMSKIDGTVEDLLRDRRSHDELDQIYEWIVSLISKMCNGNLIHGDFHWQNICYVKDSSQRPMPFRPALIDFGYAASAPCHSQLELLQALRTLHIGDMHPDNVEYLENKLHALYERKFGKLGKSFDTIDKKHSEVFYKYLETRNTLEQDFVKNFPASRYVKKSH